MEHSCIDFLKLRTIEYPMYYQISVDKSKGCCILVCEIEDPNIRLIDCPLIEIKEHEEK